MPFCIVCLSQSLQFSLPFWLSSRYSVCACDSVAIVSFGARACAIRFDVCRFWSWQGSFLAVWHGGSPQSCSAPHQAFCVQFARVLCCVAVRAFRAAWLLCEVEGGVCCRRFLVFVCVLILCEVMCVARILPLGTQALKRRTGTDRGAPVLGSGHGGTPAPKIARPGFNARSDHYAQFCTV